MSYADHVFVRTCKDILENGTTDDGFDVRPRWEDGTPAHTKMLINVCHGYELTPTSVPVMTIRRCAFRMAVDEILWIYQKQSNNVKDLMSHIWDSWAAKSGDVGSIGRAYGYQIGRRYRHHKYVTGENLDGYPSAYVSRSTQVALDIGMDPEGCDDTEWVWLNQIDGVIWSLRNKPADRAIMTNMYNHADLADMNLRPCAYSMTYMVTKNAGGELVLNGLLNQRSQDMLTANGWNVTQYAVLLQMIAQVCGMKPGKLTHMIANAHIYDRHIPIVEELIHRASYAHPNPKFWINPEVKNFQDFTLDDVKLIDYEYEPFDHKIEVAV